MCIICSYIIMSLLKLICTIIKTFSTKWFPVGNMLNLAPLWRTSHKPYIAVFPLCHTHLPTPRVPVSHTDKLVEGKELISGPWETSWVYVVCAVDSFTFFNFFSCCYLSSLSLPSPATTTKLVHVHESFFSLVSSTPTLPSSLAMLWPSIYESVLLVSSVH